MNTIKNNIYITIELDESWLAFAKTVAGTKFPNPSKKAEDSFFTWFRQNGRTKILSPRNKAEASFQVS